MTRKSVKSVPKQTRVGWPNKWSCDRHALYTLAVSNPLEQKPLTCDLLNVRRDARTKNDAIKKGGRVGTSRPLGRPRMWWTRNKHTHHRMNEDAFPSLEPPIHSIGQTTRRIEHARIRVQDKRGANYGRNQGQQRCENVLTGDSLDQIHKHIRGWSYPHGRVS